MPISFPCDACEKRFSVPDKMVGMQAKCPCGATMTIPSETVPALPEMPVTAGGAAATVGSYAASRPKSTGTAFASATLYEYLAGVTGVLYAWPVYKETKGLIEFFQTMTQFGGRPTLMGWLTIIVSIIWVLASMCIVIAGASILFQQEWALTMGAFASFVMAGTLVLAILYAYIQLLSNKLFGGLSGLHGWVFLIPIELVFLLPPAAMAFAFYMNQNTTDTKGSRFASSGY